MPTVVWPGQTPDGQWATVLAHKFDGFIMQPWSTAVVEEAKV
jgi:hypothetical protein